MCTVVHMKRNTPGGVRLTQEQEERIAKILGKSSLGRSDLVRAGLDSFLAQADSKIIESTAAFKVSCLSKKRAKQEAAR